jgi:hypothetical protein
VCDLSRNCLHLLDEVLVVLSAISATPWIPEMANAAHQSHTTSFLLEVEVKVLHHPSCCITFTKTAVEGVVPDYYQRACFKNNLCSNQVCLPQQQLLDLLIPREEQPMT